mgnify:CR=1 FL=1
MERTGGNNRAAALAIVGLLAFAAAAEASVWMDKAWTFRRQIDVDLAPDKGSGDEIVEVRFYAAGLRAPDGSDIRVADDDGKPVPHRVLRIGPGDRVSVAFSVPRGKRRFFVYWGNPKPGAPPALLDAKSIRCGLLLETRRWGGGEVNDARAFTAAWERSKETVGLAMVENLQQGHCPFGDLPQWFSRFSGTLFVPVDGVYTFAAAADDRGALVINGTQVVFAPFTPGDTRFSGKIELTRGRHEVVFWHVNFSAEGRTSVVWKTPDSQRFVVIPKQAFGAMPAALVGPLEEYGKTLVADFRVEIAGEAFFANHYSHRLRFTAVAPRLAGAPRYEWDLGNGQKAEGQTVEAVYLAEGDYPITLTVRLAGNAASRTYRVRAMRDFERASISRPAEDAPEAHSRIVGGYDLAKLPERWLPWAVLLHLRGGSPESALAAARTLLTTTGRIDPSSAAAALDELTLNLTGSALEGAMVETWGLARPDGPLGTWALKRRAGLLLWTKADFEQALKTLEPLMRAEPKDAAVQRMYGMALVLGGKPQEGARLLESIPAAGQPERRAALAGAMARTIEFYIGENDWENGEKTWDKWEAMYPADFLEGYSVLLKARLMEKRGSAVAAAKVAEAFALARPRSSYAPRLLHYAAGLLARTDSAASARLLALLREKYPEDPLAQEGATTRP